MIWTSGSNWWTRNCIVVMLIRLSDICPSILSPFISVLLSLQSLSSSHQVFLLCDSSWQCCYSVTVSYTMFAWDPSFVRCVFFCLRQTTLFSARRCGGMRSPNQRPQTVTSAPSLSGLHIWWHWPRDELALASFPLPTVEANNIHYNEY